MYTLSSQMRRAAISIPSNIAEGAARKSNKEYVQFLYIALGSSVELDTQLIISYNLGYVNDKKIITLQQQLDEIGKMLNGLITYRKTKP
jgi:four helix bundle protein